MPNTPAPEPAQPIAPSTPVPEAVIRIAKYAVSCLPRAHRSYWHFTVWVVERAPRADTPSPPARPPP